MRQRALISLKNSFERTDRFIENIDVNEGRLAAVENTLDQIENQVIDFNTQLSSALNDENASVQRVNLQAEQILERLATELNRQFGGRYLFAGTQTQSPPVDIADPDFARPPPHSFPGQPNVSYYKGNNQPLAIRADQGPPIELNVTADAPGFEKFLRGLTLIRSADIGPPVDRPRLEEAARLINEALNDISALRTQVGSVRARIDEAKQSHEDFKLVLSQQISGIENVDVTEVATRLLNAEAAIRASFQTTVQASRLSILNFL